MNKIINWVSFVLSICALIVALYLYKSESGKQSAFFYTTEIFQKFDMAVELKKNYDDVSGKRNEILDSLAAIIKLKNNEMDKLSSAERLQLKNQTERYLMLKNEFEESNTNLSKDYDEKIWLRINEYTKEYSKTKNYDFVYGVAGEGVIFYADEDMNITDDLLRYLNDRYHAKK